MRTLPACLLAAALALPTAAAAQGWDGDGRQPWYVGFGVGSGNGQYRFQGQRVNYRHHGAGDPFQLALQVEGGVTLTPNLLLGAELSGLLSQSGAQGVDYTLSVGQILAVATWFPLERGPFLRGGAGFAQISAEESGGRGVLVDPFYGYYEASARSSAGGVGILGGAGYAWWLGRRFNLTLHGDVNLHAYAGNRDAPSRSATFTAFLGFRWY